MSEEILENLFFVVNYIFGDLVLMYYAGLILVGIIFSFIYQMTKR